LARGSLFPPFGRIREVSRTIAAAVSEVAFRQGLTVRPKPEDLPAHIRSHMYDPVYRDYV
jgi:malate dehydrogenase (oxaloacetate-decarboxylating)(NADP+)